MDAQEWLTVLARELDVPVPDETDVEHLLAIASLAAHGVERWTAPVSCAMVAASDVSAREGRALVARLLDESSAGSASPGTGGSDGPEG